MTHHNQFIIHNDQVSPLILNIEPEGAFFPLSKGEEVSVVDVFTKAPITLKLTNSDKGDLILSIWPGDGEVTIKQNDVDVLDLRQKGASVCSR